MNKTFNCSEIYLTEEDFSFLLVHDEDGKLLGKLDIFTDFGYFGIVTSNSSIFKRMEEVYIYKDDTLYQLIRCMYVDKIKGYMPIWRRFNDIQQILHKVHEKRFR